MNYSSIKFESISTENLKVIKGGYTIFPPLQLGYRCKYGMNCYNLVKGPCPVETNGDECP